MRLRNEEKLKLNITQGFVVAKYRWQTDNNVSMHDDQ